MWWVGGCGVGGGGERERERCVCEREREGGRKRVTHTTDSNTLIHATTLHDATPGGS